MSGERHTRGPAGAVRYVGLRREIRLLFPVAMLLVIGIAMFTLLSYRGSLTQLAEERRLDAERLARAAASAWTSDASSAARLREWAPQAIAIGILDDRGGALSQTGDLPPLPLPPALRSGDPYASTGLSPSVPDRVIGYARLPGSAPRFLRIDLSASALAAQRRALRILAPVALAASIAALALVVLFVRHAFTPYDEMLARARAAGAVDDGEDEISGLVAAFERALAALAQPVASSEDDIRAVERALAPSLESGMLLLDRSGAVITLNPAGALILGVQSPAAGSALEATFPDAPQLVSTLRRAVAAGVNASRLEIAIPRAGERRSLGLAVHPLRRDDGAVRGYLALFADLTQARREEEETKLAESMAQLGELAAGLAHELRNSLATLRGYLSLIERRPDEEHIDDYLSEIRHETDHLQRVLEDFLSFARPGSVRLESVEVAAMVRRVARDPSLAGAEIRISSADPLPSIQADAQLLERAIRNLLLNAIEAEIAAGNERGGFVEIHLTADDDSLELIIDDHGHGVPAEIRDRLFHPFASGKAQGVGLGLALTHRIVTLHGGRLRLEDREGGGTRAILSLPSR